MPTSDSPSHGPSSPLARPMVQPAPLPSTHPQGERRRLPPNVKQNPLSGAEPLHSAPGAFTIAPQRLCQAGAGLGDGAIAASRSGPRAGCRGSGTWTEVEGRAENCRPSQAHANPAQPALTTPPPCGHYTRTAMGEHTARGRGNHQTEGVDTAQHSRVGKPNPDHGSIRRKPRLDTGEGTTKPPGRRTDLQVTLPRWAADCSRAKPSTVRGYTVHVRSGGAACTHPQDTLQKPGQASREHRVSYRHSLTKANPKDASSDIKGRKQFHVPSCRRRKGSGER